MPRLNRASRSVSLKALVRARSSWAAWAAFGDGRKSFGVFLAGIDLSVYSYFEGRRPVRQSLGILSWSLCRCLAFTMSHWRKGNLMSPMQFEWSQPSLKFAITDFKRNWPRWLFWAALFVGCIVTAVALTSPNPSPRYSPPNRF